MEGKEREGHSSERERHRYFSLSGLGGEKGRGVSVVGKRERRGGMGVLCINPAAYAEGKRRGNRECRKRAGQ